MRNISICIILIVFFCGCEIPEREKETEIQFLFNGNRYGLFVPRIFYSYNAYTPSDYTGAGIPLYNEYLFISGKDTGMLEITSTLIKGRDDSCIISDNEIYKIHKYYIFRRRRDSFDYNCKIYSQQTKIFENVKLYITLYDRGFSVSSCVDNYGLSIYLEGISDTLVSRKIINSLQFAMKK